ncbi:hypothetical protein HAX54_029311 [Datura stramonium]|uniref:Uncharacterized protein n=1 Tax=Datura stramonium TaxID=4076 RepID=A0ABS8V8A8_DATST|nr:hypothetical protein [Datura stramonium]
MVLVGNMEGEMGGSWDHGEGENVKKKGFWEVERISTSLGRPRVGSVNEFGQHLNDILTCTFVGPAAVCGYQRFAVLGAGEPILAHLSASETQKPSFASNFLDPFCAWDASCA